MEWERNWEPSDADRTVDNRIVVAVDMKHGDRRMGKKAVN